MLVRCIVRAKRDAPRAARAGKPLPLRPTGMAGARGVDSAPFQALRLVSMLHGSPNLGGAGSDLTRLLAHCADDRPVAPQPAFAERLGQWLNWTGAITLATALDAALASPVAAPTPLPAALARAQADFDSVRGALAAAITGSVPEPALSPTDFAPFRRHCLALQQAMQDAIGLLRRRLRATVARQGPALARLAAIDAVLDDTLAAQERSLLGLVPLRLQARFERLPQTAVESTAGATCASTFRADIDQLLLAELAHRLQPARGLLDALRTHSPA